MKLLANRLSTMKLCKSLVIPHTPPAVGGQSTRAGEEANEKRVKQAIREADARKGNLQFLLGKEQTNLYACFKFAALRASAGI
ncbi:MAG: hypothetical protein EPO42_03910 [Gallionellaceae bacterium]|nr:MAG: hypothetical protein EPO42_03910 [Gallionellaceae bacterium]